MPSNNTAREESGDRISHWAATAGRLTFGQRLAAMGARLFGSATEPDNGEAIPSWGVRQYVLRGYHAANLAAACSTSEELVRAGSNSGDVPYGYRARRVRVNPEGRRPRWRTRLLMEPVEASTVRMIFVWRAGEPGAWTVATVRANLRNPKYFGRQVWGRTHHGKPTPRTAWIWSEAWAHPPPVTAEEFASADRRSWHVPSSVKTKDDPANALPSDHRQAA
ncbi:recombinase [Amycolatopsis balhimycina DSM 5908]|uniref:Recombinase n=1 Tax=Amycolatopsis balhimycina DSM 5908 TaxID=1081091 RepID=A0A428VU95_AMYBA|nr:recombinase family protein [Amycolatopsis balhimycina]RSM34348.1 recombinase [Amycolatopsis balhimycina DSM 5908]